MGIIMINLVHRMTMFDERTKQISLMSFDGSIKVPIDCLLLWIVWISSCLPFHGINRHEPWRTILSMKIGVMQRRVNNSEHEYPWSKMIYISYINRNQA